MSDSSQGPDDAVSVEQNLNVVLIPQRSMEQYQPPPLPIPELGFVLETSEFRVLTTVVERMRHIGGPNISIKATTTQRLSLEVETDDARVSTVFRGIQMIGALVDDAQASGRTHECSCSVDLRRLGQMLSSCVAPMDEVVVGIAPGEALIGIVQLRGGVGQLTYVMGLRVDDEM